MEHRIDDDHRLNDATYPVARYTDDGIKLEDVPALTAINMRLRDDYTKDASGGIGRWNKIIAKTGISFELALPNEGFHRQIGVFAGKPINPAGEIISQESYDQLSSEWLPSEADGDFIQSLMAPVTEPGQFASWIAPPKVGIDNQPGEFEYVKLHMA